MLNSKVLTTTIDAPDDLRYQGTLDNETNQRKNIWHTNTVGNTFNVGFAMHVINSFILATQVACFG